MKLVGEVVSVEKVPITFDVQGGKGTIKIGDAGYAELEPYKSASGATTTLTDTVFSTVPGAPVFVGKAPSYRSKNAKLGIDLDIKGHNALQSTFVFDAYWPARTGVASRRCNGRAARRRPAPPGQRPRIAAHRRCWRRWSRSRGSRCGLWSASPYARYVDARRLGRRRRARRAVPRGAAGRRSSCRRCCYALAWVLMIAAMMLPTTLPLLGDLPPHRGRERADAGDARRALSSRASSAAWLAFGLVAHGVDAACCARRRAVRWFAAHGWIAGAAVLAVRRRFPVQRAQVPLPRALPHAVRLRHLRAGTARRRRARALRLGVDHGLFCVGCCWALMLVMFVVGIGSIGWMLALAARWRPRRTCRGARGSARPLGIALVAWGVALVLPGYTL